MGREEGLEEIAEPASLAADAIADALSTGIFHAFPDSMPKPSFAVNVVDVEMREGSRLLSLIRGNCSPPQR
jgi:hypothetical protein